MLKSSDYDKYLKQFFKFMKIPEKRYEYIEALIKKGREAQNGIVDWKKVYFITKSMFEIEI